MIKPCSLLLRSCPAKAVHKKRMVPLAIRVPGLSQPVPESIFTSLRWRPPISSTSTLLARSFQHSKLASSSPTTPGGSQVTQSAIDLIVDYLTPTPMPNWEPTTASRLEIAFGPSSTSNLENLARGLEPDIQPGDEFIVTGEHEANCGAWKKLAARRGAVVKYWHSTPTHPNNPYSFSLKVEDLLPLITAKTRIVAFTATSNLLGSVVPVQEITRALRADAAAKGEESRGFN
ncbi:Aminotran-5 domain-containing protein [Mycena indigotica]|uniref:Aminotran-5 domain-containing protein n=1 Tax=Mycena indigotica TaxID=2126181 RepID=A0A8H6SEQ9_9AGAR|nr:Aminotran-5 domain-containing protein [Mycena indigotica]KAF7297420.1 Aminotran-5 domain-containing protein [Mycena indigotica]